MSQQVNTHANTKVYISKNPVRAKFDVNPADFDNVEFVLIDGLVNLGELGAEQSTNTFELINSEWVQKSKGSRDGGTMSNQFVPLALDPGQRKVNEAIEDQCGKYAIKVERSADCVETATVTITSADPAVITWNAHGFLAGQPVVFTTTGALPTGLTAGTTYYVLEAGMTANAFSVAATPDGEAIETTAAGSGVHTGTAAPAGMTDLFQAIVTDGARTGGGRNDAYYRTFNFGVNGRIITI